MLHFGIKVLPIYLKLMHVYLIVDYPTEDDIYVTTSFDDTYSFIYVNVVIRKVYPVIRSCWHVLNVNISYIII